MPHLSYRKHFGVHCGLIFFATCSSFFHEEARFVQKKKTFFVSAQKNGENCIGVEAGGAVVPPLFKVGGGATVSFSPAPTFWPDKNVFSLSDALTWLF